MRKYLLITLMIFLLAGCKKDGVNTDVYDTVGEVKDEVTEENDIEYEQSEEANIDSTIENITENELDIEDNISDVAAKIDENFNTLLSMYDYEIDDNLRSTYRDILLNKVSFIAPYTSEEIYLDEVKFEDVLLNPFSYSIVDFNGDGVLELAFLTKVRDGGAGFTLVLHSYNGKIYSNLFSEREMHIIKRDGTFLSSGGASNSGVYKLEFVNDNYEEVSVCNSESDFDDDGKMIVLYYINQEETTESAYFEFLEEFHSKEDALWFDFE